MIASHLPQVFAWMLKEVEEGMAGLNRFGRLRSRTVQSVKDVLRTQENVSPGRQHLPEKGPQHLPYKGPQLLPEKGPQHLPYKGPQHLPEKGPQHLPYKSSQHLPWALSSKGKIRAPDISFGCGWVLVCIQSF